MAETINTTLNGQSASFEVGIEDSALEVIREQAGLTGAKLVCGSGACGACTVLVDGAAKCGCLMPATQMDGATIETIEGFAKDDLHPVQKAFLAHDGLQCGYCTPGFVTEGIAFYREWRAAHGKKRPSKAEIADAMAGHLCRCAAYIGIYNAIGSACAGEFDGPEAPDYHRVDGPEKVTGEAKYTTDIQLPGQLTGLILRSPHPHARIKVLSLEKARTMPGVKAAIRLKEGDTVRYEGEMIAALAAESLRQAYAALAAIELDFELLPFVIDPKEARKADAPNAYDDNTKNLANASEGLAGPGSWDNNTRKAALNLTASKSGQAKREEKRVDPESENCYKATFNTPVQFHTALEPHCAVADWKSDNTLTVYTSTQGVYHKARDIAKEFDLKEENVHVIAHYIGGSFGAKQLLYNESRAAIRLSREAGLPVAVINNRAEELTVGGFRPSVEIDLSVTAHSDGTKAGYIMQAYGNPGNATGSATATVSGLIYTGLSRKLNDYDVVTNFPPGAAFRGPDGPSACFSLEQGLDQIAHQLGMDPITFRRKWEEDEAYVSIFNWAEKSKIWQSRKPMGSQTGRFRKGVGLAIGAWPNFFMPSAEVEVEIGADGVTVRNALQDMGQGAKTVLAQAVSDVLNIPKREIRIEAGSSKLNRGPISAGSRTASTIYPAAHEASQLALDTVVKLLEKEGNTVEMKPTGLALNGSVVAYSELMKDKNPIVARTQRGPNKGFNMYAMLPLAYGIRLGKGRSSGAYIIEIELDTLLGKIRVERVHGAMRVGKIHVRSGAESQCYGGVIQGIGHALYEQREYCGVTGRNLARGMQDYKIPGIGDVPEIEIDFLEEGFEHVKHKGIGLAEMCTIPVSAAIANAVFNATGWRPTRGPITPQDVLAALNT